MFYINSNKGIVNNDNVRPVNNDKCLANCLNICYEREDNDEDDPDTALQYLVETYFEPVFGDDFYEEPFGLDGNLFDEDGYQEAATVTAGTFGVASLVSLSPPPLVMFPPLGLPQPLGLQPGTFNLLQEGSILTGGGALPTAAIAVIYFATILQ